MKEKIRILLCFFMAVFCSVVAGRLMPAVIVWFVLLFILNHVRLTIKNGIGFEADLILVAYSVFFAIYFTQFINIAGHDKAAGEWSLLVILDRSGQIGEIYEGLIFEFFIMIAVYFALRALHASERLAAALMPLPFMVLGLVDYYVYQFRGSEFFFSDLTGAQTALNVVSNYSFDFFLPLAALILPYVLFVMSLLRLKVTKLDQPSYVGTIMFLVAYVTAGFLSMTYLNYITYNQGYTVWGDEASYYSGYVPSFFKSIKMMRGNEPEGYSLEAVNSFADTYELTDSTATSGETSNVIVIMNESFSDFTIFSNLPLSQDPMPYWHELQQQYYGGYAYSSVYGGKTPNSEYEFLTGMSMAFLPSGTIPYTTYIKSDTYSLARLFGSQGYRTVAMHPYDASGWNRPVVYPLLGFDEMYFINDFSYTEDDIVREYMSDECAYRNLIDYIEAKPDGEKLFTFLVTIQNHGGYSDEYDNFVPDSYVDENYPFSFELNTYLSLVRRSDDALRYLLDYLSEQEERYTVLMYGDHFPSIPLMQENTMGQDNIIFKVPFLLWTNFEMNENSYISDTDTVTSSLNYLGLDVIEASGIESTPYFLFLRDIRGRIPIIHEGEFFSLALNNFCSPSTDTSDTESGAINDYSYFVYNVVFDRNESDILLSSFVYGSN